MQQQTATPNLISQRDAMKRLGFLVGKWSGTARLFPSAGPDLEMAWSEDAQYRLDGLLLVIEAAGHDEANASVRRAFGVISYDDLTGTYYMRAYNDGRFLETGLKLLDHGNGFTWGFAAGNIRTTSILQVNERGEWTERHEISVSSQPPRKFMELTAVRQPTESRCQAIHGR